MSSEKKILGRFLTELNKKIKYMIPIVVKFYNKIVLFIKYLKPIIVKLFNISFKKLKKMLYVLLLFLLKFVIIIIKLITLNIKDIIFSIKDIKNNKKRSNIDNFAHIFGNVIVLMSIVTYMYHVSANTVHYTSSAFANSTLTNVQKKDAIKQLNHAKIAQFYSKQKDHTSEIMPNNDFAPKGVNVITASALSDSPKLNGEKFNIVDKLFVNPTTDGQKFFNKIVVGAQIAAKSYGVNPSVLMAQAALESDWGNSKLAQNDNNYFGIKGSYNGQSASYPTIEETSTGSQYSIVAAFAKYPNIESGMAANASLIRNGPNATGMPANYYSKAWEENTTSYKDATLALTRTYATDVSYNQKLNKIIEDYGLYITDNHQIHNPYLVQAK